MLRKVPKMSKWERQYTAIDPMDDLSKCTCGKPNCPTTNLRPLREHMSALIQALTSCGHVGIIDGGQDPWPGTLYSLHMAVSIENVFVDPAYIDESDSGLFCDTAWEFDEEQREHSSKYVAALSIFNFIWMAYEEAIGCCLGENFSKDKPPVQSRKFFKGAGEKIEAYMASFRVSYKAAAYFCRQRNKKLAEDIDLIQTKYGLEGASAAAELMRLFRNHVVHGDDSTPLLGDSRMVVHFYASARLLLMLIQILLLHRMTDQTAKIPLSLVLDDKGELPAKHVLLNLHRPEAQWLVNCPPRLPLF